MSNFNFDFSKNNEEEVNFAGLTYELPYQESYMKYKFTPEGMHTPNLQFTMENGDEAKEIKQIIRNANAKQDVVPLFQVPFPPDLRAEDLIGLRNNSKEKPKVPNKFFIYRKWYAMCNANKGNSQTAISPHVSYQWKNEPPHVKFFYENLSKEASRLFKRKYGEDGIRIEKSTSGKKQKIKRNIITQNQKSLEIQPKIKNENEHENLDTITQALISANLIPTNLIPTNLIPPNSTPIAQFHPCLSLNSELSSASYSPSESESSYVQSELPELSYQFSPSYSEQSYLSPQSPCTPQQYTTYPPSQSPCSPQQYITCSPQSPYTPQQCETYNHAYIDIGFDSSMYQIFRKDLWPSAPDARAFWWVASGFYLTLFGSVWSLDVGWNHGHLAGSRLGQRWAGRWGDT
ncbi:hypothetical protein Glove_74g123 [Diversispora epigaea]|uniref:HMG box domain-containing protein n=1 Tax=Diversispora epigaea TaxID=1348612 RepID=A0A397JDH1_9GLOM|nr:hypothetical protein Glove_74g123 [Diversispora epigaea]